MTQSLSRFPDAEALDRELRRQGVTDILFSRQWYRVGAAGDSLGHLQPEVTLAIDPATGGMLRDLSTRARHIYSDADCDLCEPGRSEPSSGSGAPVR